MHKDLALSQGLKKCSVKKGLRGKRGPRQWKRRPLPAIIHSALMTSAGAVMFNGAAQAAPQGGIISQGQGAIERPDPATTLINQRSSAMVVDWQSFNVAEQELVRFNQPTAQSAVLNNIHDQNPSVILGRLESNGRVFLANPNGVIFGQTASVDIGSLVATTLRVDGDEFMAGRYRMEDAGGQGVVVNQGLLQAAAGGSVTLLGNQVENSGVIRAELGQINLAAGRAATLDFEGDGLLLLRVDEDALARGDGTQDAVANSGLIHADGGTVYLSAQVAKDGFKNAVNHSGLIEAARIENRGGVIRLSGSGGDVAVSAALDARADATSETGGRVEVLGDRVALTGDARIDVSGVNGGGTVLIGGDFQGKNADIANARQTYVGRDVSIAADATGQGDGGRVIVWADQTTQYHGDISAKGGAESGDGGFVEVSGKGYLDFDGVVDASATAGEAGVLLLDPQDLVIEHEGEDALPADDEVYAFTEDASRTSRMDADRITAITNNGTAVTLQASNTIEINEAIVTLNADETQNGGVGGSLTLQAGSNIAINASVTTDDGAFTAIANAPEAAGVVNDEREEGAGAITMADNVSIDAGAGDITLIVDTGEGITNAAGGAIKVEKLSTSGRVTLDNRSTALADGVSMAVAVASEDAAIDAGDLVVTGGAGAFDLAAVTANSLTVRGTGAITQAGMLDVAGAAHFETAGEGSAVTLDRGDNSLRGVVTLLTHDASSNVTLDNGDTALSVQGDVQGDLALTAGGAISDSGALVVSGTTTVTTAVDDQIITLDQLAATGKVILKTQGTAGHVTIDNSTARLAVEGVVEGDLTLSSAGEISQTGGLTVTGAGSFSSAGDTLLLYGNAINELGDVTVDGGNFKLNNGSNDLSITGAVKTLNDAEAEIEIRVGTGTLTAAQGSSIHLKNGDDSGYSDGTILLMADNMSLEGEKNSIGSSAEDAKTILTTSTSGRGINRGGSEKDDALNISKSERDSILGAVETKAEVGDIYLGSLELSADEEFRTTEGNIYAAFGLGDITNVSDGGAGYTLTLEANGTIGVGGGGDLTVDVGKVVVLSSAGNDVSLIDAGTTDTAWDISTGGAGHITIDQRGSNADLAGISTTGNLTVTSAGMITDSGDLSATGAAVLSANGNITLGDGTIANFGSLDLTGSAVTITEGSATELAAANADSLILNSAGAITDSGNLSVTGLASFTADGAISLGDGTQANFGRLDLTGSAVTITEGSATELASVNADSLTLNSDGAITDSGDLLVTGLASLTAAGAISLGDGTQANFGRAGLKGGDVTLTEGSAIELAAVEAASLILNSEGAITDSGDLNVAGLTRLNANGHAITLGDDTQVNFGNVGLKGGEVTLTEGSATELAAVEVTSLTLNSAGEIVDRGDLDVTGLARLNANGYAITLGDGTLANFGSLALSGGAVAVSERSGTELAGVDADSLTLNSAGAISDSGDLSVTGLASFNANGAITLGDGTQANFGRLALAGGSVAVTEGSATELAAVDADSLLLTSDGPIIDSGDLSVTGMASFNANGAITLGDSNQANFGSISLQGGGVALSEGSATDLVALDVDSLVLASAGAITHSGALDVKGQASFDANGHAITLGGGAGVNFGSVGLKGSAVTLTEGSATELAAVDVASLFLNSAGAITGSGDLKVTGAAMLNANGQAIALGEAARANFGTLDLAGGAIAITEGSATELVAVAADSLALNSAGGITHSGDLNVTGLARFDANGHAITLGDANLANFGSVALMGGAVTLTEGSATDLAAVDADSLALNSAGAITDSGDLNVTGAAVLNASGHAITLGAGTQANFGTLGLTGDTVSVTEGSDTELASVNAARLTLNSAGAITDSGDLSVTGLARFDAGDAITLGDATQANFGTLELAGDTVTVTEGSATELALVNAAHLTVNSAGAITHSGALDVKGRASFDANGHAITLGGGSGANFGSVGLKGSAVSLTEGSATDLAAVDADRLILSSEGAITDSGDLKVTGAARLNTKGHAITLGDGTQTNFGTLELTGGAVAITEASATELVAVGADSLALNSAGPITHSGDLNVTGLAAFNANGHAIILGDDAGANFGSVALTGGAVTLSEGSATELAAVDADSLVLNSEGAITDSGNLEVTGAAILNANGYDINLGGGTQANFGSLDLTGGAVAITEGSASELVTVDADSLTLNSAGAITHSGDLNVTGLASFDAKGYSITLGDVNLANFGSISLKGGDVALTVNRATDLAAVDAGGLTVNSAGVISDSGDLSVTGAATLNANGYAIILGDGTRANFGSLDLAGSSVTVTEDSDTHLAAVRAEDLTLTSAGDITQGDALTGIKSATLAARDITLDDAGNDFLSVGILRGEKVELTDANTLSLAGARVKGNLTITTRGALTQTGAIIDQGSHSVTTLRAEGQRVKLDAPGNDFRKVSVFAHDVALRDVSGLILGDSKVTGELSVLAGGNISDQSEIRVAGGAVFSTRGDVVLGDHGGDVTQFGSLNVNGANVNISLDADVLVTGANAERLSLVSETGSIRAAAGASLKASRQLSLLAARSIGSAGASIDLVFDPQGSLTLSAPTLYLSDGAETLVASAKNASVSGKVVSSGSQAAAGAALQDFLKSMFTVDEALFNELITIFSVTEEGIALPQDQQDEDLVFLLKDGQKVGMVKNIDRLEVNFAIWKRYGKILTFPSLLSHQQSKVRLPGSEAPDERLGSKLS